MPCQAREMGSSHAFLTTASTCHVSWEPQRLCGRQVVFPESLDWRTFPCSRILRSPLGNSVSKCVCSLVPFVSNSCSHGIFAHRRRLLELKRSVCTAPSLYVSPQRVVASPWKHVRRSRLVFPFFFFCPYSMNSFTPKVVTLGDWNPRLWFGPVPLSHNGCCLPVDRVFAGSRDGDTGPSPGTALLGD